MQTWLPYANFEETARCLDRQRLGKQRVEGTQILQILAGEESNWAHSPIVKMWRGAEFVLVDYVWTMCEEWVRRGYKDTRKEIIIRLATEQIQKLVENPGPDSWSLRQPPWLGQESLHRYHRIVLLRKNFDHYRQFWPELEGETLLPTTFKYPKGRKA